MAGSGRVWKLILGYSGFQAKSEHPFLLGSKDQIQQVFNSLCTCISRSLASPVAVELNARLRHHYCTINVTNKGKRANHRKVGKSSVQTSGSTVKQESVANDQVQSVDAKQRGKRRVRANRKKAQSSVRSSGNTVRQELVANGKIQSVESQSSVQTSRSTVKQELVANGKIQSVESPSSVQNSGSTVKQESVANDQVQSVDAKQRGKRRVRANRKKAGQSSVRSSGNTVRQELVANGKIQSVESQSSVQTSRSTVKQELVAHGKIQSVESRSSVQTSGSTVKQESVAYDKVQSGDANQEEKRRVQVLKGNLTFREYLCKLRDALIHAAGNAEEIRRILNKEASTLDTPGIEIFLGLLNCLESKPQLALEVFNWKRTRSDMTINFQEYSKSIILAGRAKDVDLAVELFAEIESRGIKKETSIYNSLMTAYVYNGLTKKTLSLFEDLKRDPDCSPTIVTYNILLSTFGRSMLVDHMEMVNQAIEESGLSPSIRTYNTVIAGYLTAWMWDEMEFIFKKMESSSVMPNFSTYSLLVRGYAFSGQVKKMEEAFDHLKKQLNLNDVPIVRAMIHAYSKSNDADKATKIESLLKFIPKEDYRPWLDVILIVVYAQADAIEKMEASIIGALDRCIMISTTSVTCSVTTTYFRHGTIDKLEAFVKQAKTARWKLCRCVYHGRMVMYGLQNHLNDMENVLEEMKSSRFRPSKKTFLILYKIYMKFGKEDEVKWTLKRMKNAGFDLPEDSQRLWEECFARSLQ